MQLDGLKVAVLVTDGYEPSELTEPVKALREAGAEVTIVSDHDGTIRGKADTDTAKVDLTLDRARPDDYGALLLPGGVKNPDTMRQDQRGVAFVRHFADSGKPIAAICHAPWMLVEADVVRGRRVTSYPSLKTDLRNAGAEWVDAGRRGRRARHLAHPEGPSGLQREDARGVRRGRPRASPRDRNRDR